MKWKEKRRGGGNKRDEEWERKGPQFLCGPQFLVPRYASGPAG